MTDNADEESNGTVHGRSRRMYEGFVWLKEQSNQVQSDGPHLQRLQSFKGGEEE